MTDKATLRAIERFTGHRSADPFKAVFLAILSLVLLLFVLGLGGCTTTTTTAPDGTVTVTKAPSAGVLPFAAAAITAYSPRPIVVREEKSGPMRRHLLTWRGRSEMAHHVAAGTDRITREEIERRRK